MFCCCFYLFIIYVITVYSNIRLWQQGLDIFRIWTFAKLLHAHSVSGLHGYCWLGSLHYPENTRVNQHLSSSQQRLEWVPQTLQKHMQQVMTYMVSKKKYDRQCFQSLKFPADKRTLKFKIFDKKFSSIIEQRFKTRKAWQSLACSPCSIAVSPPNQ